jgi:protein-S-isoprenylcysteine O-methyltransferase Ste14
MLPPVMFALAVAVMVVLDAIAPWPASHPTPLLAMPDAGAWPFWIGLALALAGMAFGLMGVARFLRAGNNISPHLPALTVVTGGIYRFTRNPMYLGLILFLAGLAIVFALEWAVIVVPVFALELHYGVVKREERYLLAKFGAPYQALTEHTRRWL